MTPIVWIGPYLWSEEHSTATSTSALYCVSPDVYRISFDVEKRDRNRYIHSVLSQCVCAACELLLYTSD